MTLHHYTAPARDFIRRWAPPGVRPLVVVLVVAGVGFFINLTSEMLEGETSGVDKAILLALRTPGHLATPIGPHWLLQSMIDLSALGGPTVVWLFSAVALGFLLLIRHWAAAGIFTLAIGGASLLNLVVKFGVSRARPEVVPHLTEVANASFPSGHAMISAAVYMTVGALLAQTQKSMLAKTYLLTVFITLALLIGVSRLYLGVHWPSDVLAGWLLGGAWALVFWIVSRRVEQATGQGQTADEPPPTA